MMIRDALHSAAKRIQPVSESARLDAQLLLMAVLGVERAYLLAHDDETLTPEQAERYESYVTRAAAGEPLPYILGKRAFFDLELFVTPDVLIPRPETELLLEEALRFAAARQSLTAVDVGTGSGALAVTFAVHAPQAAVHASDISPAALAIARRNAEKYQANIHFYEGDLLQPLIERGVKVDLLLANLPYIPHDEMLTLQVSRHEPLLALDGGADGLDLVRRLLSQAKEVCHPGALLLLEIGSGQGAAAMATAHAALETQACDVLNDYAGHDRILRVRL